MSSLKSVIISGFLLLILLSNFQITQAQKTDNKDQKKEEIQNLINSKNYIFIAQSVLPLSGRLINLTTVYSLKVNSDSLVSDLPYFGRAFVAPLNPDDAGIHFTSTDFAYTITDRKKGGWDITIAPKDSKDVKQLFLSVSENGYASLQVNSNSKQSIGYNGYVTSARSK